MREWLARRDRSGTPMPLAFVPLFLKLKTGRTDLFQRGIGGRVTHDVHSPARDMARNTKIALQLSYHAFGQ